MSTNADILQEDTHIGTFEPMRTVFMVKFGIVFFFFLLFLFINNSLLYLITTIIYSNNAYDINLIPNMGSIVNQDFFPYPFTRETKRNFLSRFPMIHIQLKHSLLT